MLNSFLLLLMSAAYHIYGAKSIRSVCTLCTGCSSLISHLGWLSIYRYELLYHIFIISISYEQNYQSAFKTDKPFLSGVTGVQFLTMSTEGSCQVLVDPNGFMYSAIFTVGQVLWYLLHWFYNVRLALGHCICREVAPRDTHFTFHSIR